MVTETRADIITNNIRKRLCMYMQDNIICVLRTFINTYTNIRHRAILYVSKKKKKILKSNTRTRPTVNYRKPVGLIQFSLRFRNEVAIIRPYWHEFHESTYVRRSSTNRSLQSKSAKLIVGINCRHKIEESRHRGLKEINKE